MIIEIVCESCHGMGDHGCDEVGDQFICFACGGEGSYFGEDYTEEQENEGKNVSA